MGDSTGMQWVVKILYTMFFSTLIQHITYLRLMVARLAQTCPCQWHLHSLWDGTTIYCSSSSCCRCRLLDLRYARSRCNSGTSRKITVIFVVWFQQCVNESSLEMNNNSNKNNMFQSWLDSWNVLLTPITYRNSLTFRLVFYLFCF